MELNQSFDGPLQNLNQKGHDGCYVNYYMKEVEGDSPQGELDHVRGLISHQWKVLNKEYLSRKLS